MSRDEKTNQGEVYDWRFPNLLFEDNDGDSNDPSMENLDRLRAEANEKYDTLKRKTGDVGSSVIVKSDENMPLLIDLKKPINSTTAKAVGGALNNFLIAVNFIGNSLILTSLGPIEAGAAGLINSFQAVINGSIVGVLLNSTYEIGKTLGEIESSAEERDSKVGAIVKTGWVIGSALCLVSTGCFLSLQAIMPRIMHAGTGIVVGNYFRMFAIGSFSEPLGAASGVLIGRLETGTLIPLLVPFFSMALYRVPALALAYYFSHNLGMGADGVGLGGAVAGIFSFVLTQAWFSREIYRKYNLFNCKIPDFATRLKSYLSGGWKLSLQRFTEWGNMAIIASLVGVLSNISLEALLPALQANTLIALSLQGMAQTVMSFVSTDFQKKIGHQQKFQTIKTKDELEKFLTLRNKNKRAFIKYNIAGLVFTGLFCGGIYLARRPIIDLFLVDPTPEQSELAETLLSLNLVGLIPDALRIVSSGALRALEDLLFPTLASLVCMTVLGIPAGGVATYFCGKNIEWIFWARGASLVVAATVNCFRFHRHMKADDHFYEEGKKILKMSNSDGVSLNAGSLNRNDDFKSRRDIERNESTVVSPSAKPSFWRCCSSKVKSPVDPVKDRKKHCCALM